MKNLLLFLSTHELTCTVKSIILRTVYTLLSVTKEYHEFEVNFSLLTIIISKKLNETYSILLLFLYKVYDSFHIDLGK